MVCSIQKGKDMITEEQKFNDMVGKTVRDHRIKKGLTQNELATMIGMNSKDVIYNRERGRQKFTFYEIMKINKILNLPIDEWKLL